MTDIVILGIQGSGKGTQARKIIDKFPNFYYFEMGKVFREYMKKDTPFAKCLKEKTNKGYLSTDEDVMKLFLEEIEEIKKNNNGKLPENMIFDGIPRKLGQKHKFDEWMSSQGRDFVVIDIEIPEDEALHRLAARKTCTQCGKTFPAKYRHSVCDECGSALEVREDETQVDAVQKRIQQFKEYTVPVLEEYKNQGKLISINGQQNPEAVFEEILQKLKNIFK